MLQLLRPLRRFLGTPMVLASIVGIVGFVFLTPAALAQSGPHTPNTATPVAALPNGKHTSIPADSFLHQCPCTLDYTLRANTFSVAVAYIRETIEPGPDGSGWVLNSQIIPTDLAKGFGAKRFVRTAQMSTQGALGPTTTLFMELYTGKDSLGLTPSLPLGAPLPDGAEHLVYWRMNATGRMLDGAYSQKDKDSVRFDLLPKAPVWSALTAPYFFALGAPMESKMHWISKTGDKEMTYRSSKNPSSTQDLINSSTDSFTVSFEPLEQGNLTLLVRTVDLLPLRLVFSKDIKASAILQRATGTKGSIYALPTATARR